MERQPKNITRREFLGAGLFVAAFSRLAGSVESTQREFRETYNPDGRTHIVESTGTTNKQFNEAFGEQFAGPKVEGSIHQLQNPQTGEITFTPTEGVDQATLEKVFGQDLGQQVQE